MLKRIIVLLLFISITMNLSGQDLKDYKWKNRIILIISNSETSELFKEQIKELELDHEGLDERQLVVYKVLPSKYKLNSNNWITNSGLYKTYNSEGDCFKIVLIGLDGGIKLSQNKLLTKNQLFSTIDGMPMRRAQLKNKQ
ncbi:DUF4174 domain-containing protein [Winogradskyella sp.]|uniref:DUF4174 domain-containing protein n=1 Tax=Winogradskyella sp. TaxID=1883156 RepID=UPI003F6B8D13